MLTTVGWFVLVFCCVLPVHGTANPTESYSHDVYLDDLEKVKLYWKYDDTTITFEVHAQTLGYVGFGISPNGGMTNADIVIGWVKDGQVFFKDRFATQNGEPSIDSSQDYELIEGMETETHTILKFTRKLETCDDRDITISEGTLRLIFSYHQDDPESETGLSYHGNQRGTRSIHLLGYTPELPQMPTGDDLLTYEFLNPNITVPHDQGTTYWCMAFKMPTLDSKHHMIKYEPVIQPGHEALVHHILIYQCPHQIGDEYDGTGHECYQPNMPVNMSLCSTAIISWAIGGGAFYLPEEAGFSLGDMENGDPDFIVMETHYDNPDFVDTFVDSSGIRIYYTPILRDNDAGILEVGNDVGLGLVIPPFASNFITTGFCTEACLSEVFGESSGITIFASLLHAHLGGISIHTRHFRNGVERDAIASDDSYDFNFQEMRYLRQPVNVVPGDSIVLECAYNTESRTTMTYGGLSTQEEMCLNFLFYYPRFPVSKCQSSLIYNVALGEILGVTDISYDQFPPVILAPPEYAGISVYDAFDSLEWNEEERVTLQDSYKQMSLVHCEGNNQLYNADEIVDFNPPDTSVLPPTESTCPVGAATALHCSQMGLVVSMLYSSLFILFL